MAANEAARESRRGEPGEESDAPVEAPWEPEEWIDEGMVRDEAEVVRDEAEGAVRRGLTARQRPRKPRSDSVAPAPPAALEGGVDAEVAEAERELRHDGVAGSVDEELRNALGMTKGVRAQKRMREAGDAFKRGRFDEARVMLRPLAESAPRVAALRELYGLSLYRMGRWKQAAAELEAFRTLSGSADQHPVLADCYRALRRYDEAEQLWNELREASPSSELVAEGRIVYAGSLADQGRVDDAIQTLEASVRPTRRAKPHHLRVAYALADLYERAGDLPRARELFQRVAVSDPEFVDVQARLQALR
jgi:tetratricopeptide (TPR) repeat protein